jgi:hypothetical protein
MAETEKYAVRRWRTTLILLGVFAALLGYVLLVERKREPPPGPGATPSPTPSPLIHVTREDILALQITSGSAEVRIERQQDGWQITLPQIAPADAYGISWPIDELAHLQAERTVLDTVNDPGQYGLDPVQLTLVIETVGGSERLYAGRETPDGTAYYVQIEGDPHLYIVEHYKVRPLFEWIDQPPYQPTPTPAAGA